MVEEPCFLRTKKERIHRSSSYSIASSLKKCKPFFQFFSLLFNSVPSNTLRAGYYQWTVTVFQRFCIQRSFLVHSRHFHIYFFFPPSIPKPVPAGSPTVRSTFFFSSSHLSQTSTSRILSSVSNTLWAPRVSFEIRHLRRLRLERSRESLSRSWWLAQSYPAHVADGGKYPAGAYPSG